MPTTIERDGMSREVAGRRWSLADVLAFYETHGRMPFPLAGGDVRLDDFAVKRENALWGPSYQVDSLIGAQERAARRAS